MERSLIWKWCARGAWIALPFTLGFALADELGDWSTAPKVLATVLLWLAWGAGAVALFAPRPWGFSVLRVVAPSAVVVAALAGAPAATKTVGIVVALFACVLTLGAPIARTCANSIAYGDEDRYPLSVPLTIAIAPLPIAVALVALGAVTGPLLLADGRIVAGIVAVIVGFPLAVLAANSVQALSRRWLVLVPAGVVVVDSLTLGDPTLMPREQIAALDASTSPHPDLLDLRLAAARGTITITLREPAYFARRRGRANVDVITATAVRTAVVDRSALLAARQRRRLPVDHVNH
jgi:hypothetical protein